MCRGCNLFTKEGKHTTYEYLECFDEYKALIHHFGLLNDKVFKYKETLDKESRSAVDKFHKELVRIKKDLGSAEEKLNLITTKA